MKNANYNKIKIHSDLLEECKHLSNNIHSDLHGECRL